MTLGESEPRRELAVTSELTDYGWGKILWAFCFLQWLDLAENGHLTGSLSTLSLSFLPLLLNSDWQGQHFFAISVLTIWRFDSRLYPIHVPCWQSSPLSEKQETFIHRLAGFLLEPESAVRDWKPRSARTHIKISGLLCDWERRRKTECCRLFFNTFPHISCFFCNIEGNWGGRMEQHPWLRTFSGFGRSNSLFWLVITLFICILTPTQSGTTRAFIDPGCSSPVLSKLLALLRTLARWKIPK